MLSTPLYWYWAAGDVLAESSTSGTLTAEYVFFHGRRIARRDAASGAIRYYFSDHLGSASVITNEAGTIVEESQYFPFGAERAVLNGDTNPYKFTAKERDSESGLDYFGARHYASTMGRFMQPDEFTGGPVEVYGGDPTPPGPLPYADIFNPQSLNKYSYTYNNPLRYTDPDGHEVICTPCLMEAIRRQMQNPATRQFAAGAAKIGIGVGLVATAAVGDVPGGAVGATVVGSVVLGGTTTAVSGVADVAGAATNTNVQPATEALDATGTFGGLVVTAATGGNMEAGKAATTLTDAAALGRL